MVATTLQSEQIVPQSLVLPNAPVFAQPRPATDSWKLPPELLEQGRILIIDTFEKWLCKESYSWRYR